ncbi:protein SLOW WALKER 2 [Lycium barbarum]|uniref:protein SLOW WALKER 2 n=1 Tax=Lycium barbarum TaxID=112863 RepID=UPI00293E8F32|nr:protein SLOW WALKER 2 [Lycium barbarum]
MEDIEAIKSDVASFASSLGLATSSGFDDSDFRKKGRIKKDTKDGNQNNKNRTNNDKFAKNSDKFVKKPKVEPQVDNNNNLWNTKYKNMPKLPLVKASALAIWYVDAEELEEKVIGSEKKSTVVEFKNVDEWKKKVEKKKELGERLLAQYAQDYESSRGQSGDIKMLLTTLRSGTAADKISAFSVMIGDNPTANLRSLDALLGMVTAKVGKRHALSGLEALKELFVSSLLPDRKLKTLFQRPIDHIPDTKDGYSLLLFWYWEECLKQRYERYIAALEEASRDVLDILKDKALKTVYVLLKCKPEQERRLLAALVNKLGDPKNKVASNADYHLSKLLADHPNMKAVVIEEVDNFLFRPRLVLRAKYHAVNFLSQIRLSHRGDGPKVAKRLIDVYFALFKVLISEAGEGRMVNKKSEGHKEVSGTSKDKKEKDSSETHVEMDSRLLSALLTGVNRAFPYVSSDEADDVIQAHTPVLFQLVHSTNFNVGVQALMLLDKISAKNHIVSDRFYRALYAKLLLPAAMNSSKEELFIGLLLRAMKNDVNVKRIAAFSKRLLQVAIQQPPQYACGCLFLLSEVLKSKPTLWNMMLQSESVDDDLEHFEDIIEEDENQPSPPNRTDNASEVEANHLENGNHSLQDEGGSSEPDDDDSLQANESPARGGLDEPKESRLLSGFSKLLPEGSNEKLLLPGGYDTRHREPSFCNADRVSWWELMVLASHAHPSVATMARTLLSGANIVYNGNPLNDLSLTAFLDKFMEKKPKHNTWHGGSQIEPAKKLDMQGQLIGSEILSLAETDVPPEDLVFHKFYVNKMKSSKKPKKKKKKTPEDDAAEEFLVADGSDVEDEIDEDAADDSENEEIDSMLESGGLPLEANGEYDYSDLDDVVNEDDDELIGDASDEDMDALLENDGANINSGSDDDNDAEKANDDDEEDDVHQRKKKRRKDKRVGKSPFASLDDYEHLLNEDNSTKESPKKHIKSRTKRKSNEEIPKESTEKPAKSRKQRKSSK